MEKHWLIITLVVIAAGLFIVFYLIKNRRDKKAFMKTLDGYAESNYKQDSNGHI
ncbi:hypothetical protein ACFQZX_17330 [Mucilaginibacter litoreus]|uniref:LPXTG-motif cell wall anchor domain-containing protein n=1 Tax=Mucilaginibacter litoreus TaxID=1048221 RepID=A0ABW3AXW2_9SPHI